MAAPEALPTPMPYRPCTRRSGRSECELTQGKMAGDPYDRFTEFLTSTKRDQSHEHAGRSPVSKDRDRVIHCGAFRRLQRKSQIVGVQANDFFRTRLTHTVECAQIGRGIANRSLGSNLEGVVGEDAHLPDLIEAACLAHDLGHPPFGHNGERALQAMMYKHARRSFEGNAESFRIVTNLEPKYQEADRWCGLDLTRTTLQAILKYPWDENDERAKEKKKFCIYDEPEDQDVFAWLFDGEEPKRTIATDILDAATPGDAFAEPTGDVQRKILLLKGMARVWMIESASQETLRFGQRRLVEDLFEGYWANTGMLQREAWARVTQPTQSD